MSLSGYVHWLSSKIPGYGMVKKWHRYRQLERCRKLKKKDKEKWRFPKYLLYDIKGTYIPVGMQVISSIDISVTLLKHWKFVYYSGISTADCVFRKERFVTRKLYLFTKGARLRNLLLLFNQFPVNLN